MDHSRDEISGPSVWCREHPPAPRASAGLSAAASDAARLQARRCGHGSAVRVSWVHINRISARINAGKLAGHSLTTARLFSRTARILFQRFDIEPTHGDRGTLRRPSIDCAADQHQLFRHRRPRFTLIQFRHASMQESWPGIPACWHGVRDTGMVVSLATCPVSRRHFGATDGAAPPVASGATIAS